MTFEIPIRIRVDRVTKLRLESEAASRGIDLSKLVRGVLWDHVRVPVPSDGNGSDRSSLRSTFDELQGIALERLRQRFNEAWSTQTFPDPLRWVRACISEIPELVHADPRWVLSQLQPSEAR